MAVKDPPQGSLRLEQDSDRKWAMRLYGIVGDELDGFTDEDVADALSVMDGSIRVRMNTPGGAVFQGIAIHNALRSHEGEVEVIIDGLAASMGPIIASAGDRVRMYRGSMLMVHNPWNIAMGDANEMRRNAEVLDKVREATLSILEQRTGQDRDTLTAMMDEETWLTAQEAVEWGLADEVIEEAHDTSAAMASVDLSILPNLPNELAQAVARARLTGNHDCAPHGQPIAGSAGTTAADAANPKQQHEGDDMVDKQTNSPADGSAGSPMDETAIRERAARAERERVSEISRLVRTANLEASVADELIQEGVSVDAAKGRIFDKMAEQQETITSRVTVGREEHDTRVEGVRQALLNRFSSAAYPLQGDSPGRDYRGMSLMEIAREFVEADGKSTRGMSRNEIAGAAFHTTSDFPGILENIATKTLRDAYEQAPRTFEAVGRQTTLPDYKEVSRAQLGETPSLRKVVEHGEYERGEIGDAAEKYRLFKYGRVVAITREVIINDDLDAFTRIPALFGRSAAELEGDLFWEVVTSNPAMHDGTALFHSDHGNLASSGSAISISSIGAGRTAMRKQTGLNGQRINVMPQYLVVPAALETDAEQHVSDNYRADSAGNINVFANRLGVISEPRLDDDSEEAWYLFASPQQIDTIEYAYLQGEEGPQIETREGFDVDGMEVKCRLDFGVKAIDWRGMYKNPGE